MKSSGLNKKLISVLLSLIMVLSTLMGGGISAFAADSGVEEVVTVEEPSSLDTPASEPGILDPEDEGSKSSPESTPAISEEGSGDKQEESAPEKTEPAAGTGSGEEYVPTPDQGETGSVQEIVSKAESVPEAAPVIVYPAQEFRGETPELIVRVYAPEGVFPEGTRMNLVPVSADVLIDAAKESGMEEAAYAVAVDITFFDKDDNELQPNDDVRVTLTARRKIEGEEHQAVTMDEEGNVEVVAEATARASVFETGHFTVYGIIGSEYEDDVEQYVRHTYEFYAGDPSADPSTWTKVDSQIVRNGDSLTLPADPEGDSKHVFSGWYKEGGSERVSAGTVTIKPATLSEDPSAKDQTVKVYAKFDKLYKVTMYTDEDKSSVFNTVLAKDGETVSLPDPDTAQEQGLIEPYNRHMLGWKYVGEDRKAENDQVTIEGADIDLAPDFAKIHQVKFDLIKTAFDAEPVTDEIVLTGETVKEPDYVIGNKYKGYEFGGWFTEENYHPDATDPADEFTGEPYDFSKPLTIDDPDEFTLYAKWTAVDFNYTIDIYRESAHAGEEEFIFYQENLISSSEENISIYMILNSYPADLYEYFHRSGDGVINGSEERAFIEVVNGSDIVTYDSSGELVEGDPDTAKINPDGSTVVNIYYCRDSYHLHVLFANWITANTPYTEIVSPDDGAWVYGTYGGYTYVNNVLSDTGKQYAPEGYADVELPVLDVKYDSELSEDTRIFYDYGDLFDTFQHSSNWFFARQDFNGLGESLFDGDHAGSKIKPNTNIGDGGDLHLLICVFAGKKIYKYQKYYYDREVTYEEIAAGTVQPVRYGSVQESYYHPKDSMPTGHTHKVSTIGNKSGGYKTVAVTNFRYVKLAGTSAWVTEANAQPLPNGQHTYTWKNGLYNEPEIGPDETIIVHVVPAKYKITFKQSSRNGKVNGWSIDDDYEENNVVINNIYVNTPIDIEQMIADNGLDAGSWVRIKDDQGRVYGSGDDDWEGGLVDGAFPTKMPGKDLTFYRTWEEVDYTVTFDLNGYEVEGKEIHDFPDILHNAKIPDPKEQGFVDRGDGWVLLRWEGYERNEDGTPGAPIEGFALNMPVEQDMYIKAIWAKGDHYSVEYDEGGYGTLSGATGGKLLDDEAYLMGSKAPVKYVPEPDEGYVFIGWAIGGDTSKMVGGGDLIEYTEDGDALRGGDPDKKIVLVAQYETQEHETWLTYHANYPDGSDVTVSFDEMVPNGDCTIKAPDDSELSFGTTFTTSAGVTFVFKCWTNSFGESIYSGSDAREYYQTGEVPAAGIKDNHLYAVWEIEQEYIEIPVTKIWDDENDSDGKRPKSITVRLYADGKEIDSLDVTSADDWKFSFEDLPKYADGKQIVYTITEDAVPEYSTQISEDTYTITNTHKPPKKTPPDKDTPPDKNTPPKTGENSQPLLWMLLMALAGAGFIALRRRRQR